MLEQLTLWDFANATSSPVLAGGPSPSRLPDGQKIARSGPVPALANHFPVLASGKAQRTPATCGRGSAISSFGAILQSRLENRLQARMACFGSPEYALTWKHSAMRSGPPICALRASRPHTPASGCTGWRTPTSGDAIRGVENNPRARNAKAGTASLNNEAALAGWRSPNTIDARGGSRNGQGQVQLCHQAMLAGWCSPTAQDGERGDKGPRPQDTGIPLSQQATMVLGASSTCAPSETEKRGALNPAHSRWLMGFPAAWDSCGATAMQSCRRSRRSSSARG